MRTNEEKQIVEFAQWMIRWVCQGASPDSRIVFNHNQSNQLNNGNEIRKKDQPCHTLTVRQLYYNFLLDN